MPPPINIEDPLNKRKVEDNWINEQKHRIIWLSLGLGLAVALVVYLMVR